mgnify:CR=1 FL=1
MRSLFLSLSAYTIHLALLFPRFSLPLITLPFPSSSSSQASYSSYEEQQQQQQLLPPQEEDVLLPEEKEALEEKKRREAAAAKAGMEMVLLFACYRCVESVDCVYGLRDCAMFYYDLVLSLKWVWFCYRSGLSGSGHLVMRVLTCFPALFSSAAEMKRARELAAQLRQRNEVMTCVCRYAHMRFHLSIIELGKEF